MANEDKKDFNAMLHRANGMPRVQLVTDKATVKKYGGTRMYRPHHRGHFCVHCGVGELSARDG